MDSNKNEFFGKWLAITHNRLFHLFTKVFQKEGIDLTFEQFLMLKILSSNEGISQQDLAVLLDKDKTSIARAINILEDKHKVVRIPSKEDKRKKVLYLTKEGRRYKDEVLPTFLRIRDDIEACLDKNELDKMVNTLKTINQQIDKIEKTL